MIKRFIRRVLGLRTDAPQRVPSERHGLRREALSQSALKVCDVLREAGYSASVVGGAVRDLLLEITPKDYDVATDARPEQVKPLFRRALIIGRRFRLVHVMLGQETVEVSTFRAADANTAEKDEHGRVLRDNVFGTQEEDARRRDFTINALYFDPATEEIIDYHGGLADLKKRVLRMIGDATTRFREDPVRMLRAVRLAAKLGLSIEAGTRAPIRRLAPLIEHVPPARVFDEQPLEGVDLDVRVLAKHLADDLDPLGGGEERLLVLVDQHGDENSLEQVCASQDDIDVPVRNRVERTGKDCQATIRGIRWAHRCSDVRADARALVNIVNVLSPDLTSRTRSSDGGTSGS